MGFKDGIETLSTDGQAASSVSTGLGSRDREVVNYFAIYPNFLLTLRGLHDDDHHLAAGCRPHGLTAEWHFHPAEMAKKDFVFQDA